MKKRLFVTLFLVVAIVCTSMAPVFATRVTCCQPSARGDYQILENDASGATVRAWISNNCRFNRFAYVTVVANAKDGSGKVQGAYAVFLNCFGARPVDVRIAVEILNVDRIIATSQYITFGI